MRFRRWQNQAVPPSCAPACAGQVAHPLPERRASCRYPNFRNSATSRVWLQAKASLTAVCRSQTLTRVGQAMSAVTAAGAVPMIADRDRDVSVYLVDLDVDVQLAGRILAVLHGIFHQRLQYQRGHQRSFGVRIASDHKIQTRLQPRLHNLEITAHQVE